jgi:hypothetical protein
MMAEVLEAIKSITKPRKTLSSLKLRNVNDYLSFAVPILSGRRWTSQTRMSVLLLSQAHHTNFYAQGLKIHLHEQGVATPCSIISM